jgi:hypothetical protein
LHADLLDPWPTVFAVAHEVTNDGSDRAKEVLGVDELEAVADRGYYSSEEILTCDKAGITVTLPKPITSGLEAKGRFGKQDFVYLTDEDVYRCPAGEKLAYHYTNEENGLVLRRYWTNACQSCAIKQRCTTGKERRITRWEHEHVLARDRRTSLRHAEDEDGSDALPDEASAQGRNRDGAPCARLQSHQSDEYHGHPAADGRDPSIVKAGKSSLHRHPTQSRPCRKVF